MEASLRDLQRPLARTRLLLWLHHCLPHARRLAQPQEVRSARPRSAAPGEATPQQWRKHAIQQSSRSRQVGQNAPELQHRMATRAALSKEPAGALLERAKGRGSARRLSRHQLPSNQLRRKGHGQVQDTRPLRMVQDTAMLSWYCVSRCHNRTAASRSQLSDRQYLASKSKWANRGKRCSNGPKCLKNNRRWWDDGGHGCKDIPKRGSSRQSRRELDWVWNVLEDNRLNRVSIIWHTQRCQIQLVHLEGAIHRHHQQSALLFDIEE